MPNLTGPSGGTEGETERETVSEGEAQAPREMCKVVSVTTSLTLRRVTRADSWEGRRARAHQG